MGLFGLTQGCSYFKVVTERDRDFINQVLREIKADKQHKAVLSKSISAGDPVNQIEITKK